MRSARPTALVWAGLLAACTACTACTAERTAPNLELPSSRLIVDPETARVDLTRSDGSWILSRATAWALVDAASIATGGRKISLTPPARIGRESIRDSVGVGERLTVQSASEDESIPLSWILTAYDEGFYTFEVTVENRSGAAIALAKTVTLHVDAGDGGGLFVGTDPRDHRILENGSHMLMDHLVEIRTGDTEASEILSAVVPGDFSGHSVSNWNHAVVDLAGAPTWVAGALEFESSLPVFNLTHLPSDPVAPDGRAGFGWFSAEAAYLPDLKILPPGERFSTGRTYVAPVEPDPFSGLERYAEAVKRSLAITLWTERAESHRVPNGWNSWTGSSGTGGYGTDIDEAIILANLDVMAKELRDFGMDYFQIDDGYETAVGDWTDWRADRFPHGPRWLAEQIRSRDLKPGLWMAPFTPSPDSTLARAHPDWIAERTDLANILASGTALLDLTHPEVKQWLRDLFHRFREEWGFEWLKIDFAYWALLGRGLFDPNLTREEAYRGAMRIIREEIGPESFLLTVAIMGTHYGLADADRITVDSMPIWDWFPEDAAPLNQQGLKPTVRTAARRWYLHDRIWINHPDLIFFRSNTVDAAWPRLTLEESQAFASYVGLSGGIVKLGDRLVDLAPEHLDTVRKLLPIYGRGARPLDLFAREFPEIFHLPIEVGLGGFAEPYDLVGLFNWGKNHDLTTNPFTPIPDLGDELAFDLPVSRLGLASGTPRVAYEFWTGAYLGVVGERLSVSVPSHAARVVALRPALDRPQFLGWNRQLTMGGTDLEGVEWDPAAKILRVSLRVQQGSGRVPFTYRLAFRVPAPFRFVSVQSADEALQQVTTRVVEEQLILSFTPSANARARVELLFDGP